MAVDKRRRIVINFKNTAEEIELYETIKKHSSASAYIKDVLKGISEMKIKEDTSSEIDVDDVLGGIL